MMVQNFSVMEERKHTDARAVHLVLGNVCSVAVDGRQTDGGEAGAEAGRAATRLWVRPRRQMTVAVDALETQRFTHSCHSPCRQGVSMRSRGAPGKDSSLLKERDSSGHSPLLDVFVMLEK